MKSFRWSSAILVVGAVAASACRDAAAPQSSLLFKVAGDSQAAFPGDTLPQLVRVRVTDLNGGVKAGVWVRFDGSNATANPDSAPTDANGVASSQIIVGLLPVNGAGVRVVVHGSTVDFRIRIKNPCDYPGGMAIGANVSGAITQRDCVLNDGTYLDAYDFTVDSTSRIHFVESATAGVTPFIFIVDTTGWTLATSTGAVNDSAGSHAAADVLLPPGRYQVWANTLRAGEFGSYQLASSSEPVDIPDCVTTYVRGGLDVAQTLPARTCQGPDDSLVAGDNFRLVAIQNDTISIAATASGFRARIRLFANTAPVVSATAQSAGRSAQISYIVPQGLYGAYVIQVSSADSGVAGGSYSIAVGRTGPMSTAVFGAPAALRMHAAAVSGGALIRE